MVRFSKSFVWVSLVGAAALTAGLLFAGTASAQSDGNAVGSSIDRPRPSSEPEIRRLRIQWHADRTLDTYTEGIANERPILIFFHGIQCGFCIRQLDRFRCPHIVRHAGFLEFGYTVNDGGDFQDEAGGRLAEVLDVQRFPTVVMLMPDLDKIHVIGRIEGEFSAAETDSVFRNAYDSDPYRQEIGPPPVLLSASETATMLDQLGIARPSEAFCANTDR